MCYDPEFYIPSTKRAYRYRANKIIAQYFDKECMLCGCKKNIHVHHIDGNEQNNELLNLMYLCKKCHCGVHQVDQIFGSD